jgi:hypothetical protein
MGEPFNEGSYIDDQRRVRFGDDEADPFGRWVDEDGYLRLPPEGMGDYDDYRYVDIDGRLHDKDGNAVDVWFELPSGWGVGGPSPTVGGSVSPQAMATFEAGIAHTAAADALGSKLDWASGDAPKTAADLHGHALQPDYVGEDQRAGSFAKDTLRQPYGDSDQWVTEYDPAETESVQKTKIAADVLLGKDGKPLDGSFGYVVDPSDGSLYVFDRSEAYVTKNGEWVPLKGVQASAAVIKEALAAGEHISWVHHSTPVAGRAVAGAGVIKVQNGVIVEINDESGHYKPEGEYLWQTIEWLAAQGMDVSKIDVKMIQKDRNPEVVLKGWQAQLARGNQAQAAAKRGVNAEIRAIEAERERKRRIARLGPGAEDQHRDATGCENLSPSQDLSYCMSCDQDL